jgi:hypothetical protein
MDEPFTGSAAVAAGALSKSALRTRCRRIFPDVYVGEAVELTADAYARAAWLWSGRQATVAGRSAAAVLGSRWIDSDCPVDLLHGNRNAPAGITVHGDRAAEDEILWIGELPVTSPARTALDLACWFPTSTAVACLDALAAATRLDPADAAVLADRYPGRRGIRRARQALALVDAGAQSPRETRLRLLLVHSGLPTPRTQIPVQDDTGVVVAHLDMGWEDLMVAVEYDGEQHRTDRRQYTWDVRRLELLERLGWIVVRVVAGDRPVDIVRRVKAAIARRTLTPPNTRRSA